MLENLVRSILILALVFFCFSHVRRTYRHPSNAIFVHVQPLEAAAAAAIGTSAAPAGDASSAAAAPTRSTTVDETAKPRKIEGAMEVNSAAATASSRLDARDTPSPVGGVETDKNEVMLWTHFQPFDYWRGVEVACLTRGWLVSSVAGGRVRACYAGCE